MHLLIGDSIYSQYEFKIIMMLSGLKLLFLLMGSALLPNSVYADVYQSGHDSAAYVSVALHLPENTSFIGYNAIARIDDGFLAVGTDGRMDRISASGKTVQSEKIPGEHFNCVLSDNKKVVVAGDHGIIMVSSDHITFRRVSSGTDQDIHTLALFKTLIFAATNDGAILTGSANGTFSKSYPAVKGNVVSLSADTSECFGATDKGEIIRSADGYNWEVFDFNSVYAGFYKPCLFKKILVTSKNIAVTGVYIDGSPVLMFSEEGNVWTERTLNYTDEDGVQGILADAANDMYYEASLDLFFLACDNGKVMKIPACSHCNKLAALPSGNLMGISGNSNMLMVVGAGFYTETLNPY